MKMDYDDVAWERSDIIFDGFKEKIICPDVLLAVTKFMASHHPDSKPVDRARIADLGAFNLCFRMIFEDGFSSLLRFPCPGRVMFPEEKVRNEVDVMTFLKENTNIPVPNIIHHGMGDESPAGLGPFILMEYVAHASNSATQLRAPGYEKGDRPFLNPDIEEEKLVSFYGQVANILLELSKLSFDKIGSLSRNNNANGWSISNRPLTMNMNELVQLGNFPPQMLPQSPYTTASSYYQTLARTEFMHLETQRNDAVNSEEDCRSKYISRKLFIKLAAESRLHNHDTDSGPFKLFCDDLRPTNILLDDDMNIAAVIDWEFTYAAPAEFTHSPPWWLLLEMPEEWPHGLLDWTAKYQPCLEIFLRALKQQEDASITAGTLVEEQRLSGKMQESWEQRDFWVQYGARKSWAFDAVWPMIDAKFFGGDRVLDQRKLVCNEERMKLLSVADREAMEPFVRKKLEDSKQRKLDDWDEVDTVHLV